ncbi:MAG: GtrA family protein [Muribaculaceae bacterium]|nr:GtrA family protein [Muribaculaceae bacterium]MDE6321284.1 GtrA family protein [Muribaculaceae bacterium]
MKQHIEDRPLTNSELVKQQATTQFIKYAVVGVMNTMVTLIVIFVCKSLLGVPEVLSNALGYIAGVVNSFMWNKTWVFRSKKSFRREAVKFAIGFGLCYVLQLGVVLGIDNHSPISGMEWDIMGFTLSSYGVATLIGMVVYTMANFVYNKTVAFK